MDEGNYAAWTEPTGAKSIAQAGPSGHPTVEPDKSRLIGVAPRGRTQISPDCEGTNVRSNDRIHNASTDANVTTNHETTDKTTDDKEPEVIDNQIANTNAYPTDAR